MADNHKNWPMILAITAGLAGGIVAALYVYGQMSTEGSEAKLRDAAEIIEQCHRKIREIEESVHKLREPTSG